MSFLSLKNVELVTQEIKNDMIMKMQTFHTIYGGLFMGNNNIEQELSKERTMLSHERTDMSILRTNLSFINSKLSVEQTHLSFLRTEVSLVGSAATIYKALPALGVSDLFSSCLTVFLLAAALYFFVKDRTTYPGLKKDIEVMEDELNKIIESNTDLKELAQHNAKASSKKKKDKTKQG